MDQKVVEMLNRHRLLTIATNRPDGWPQSTTVGYVNDGLLLYFLISRTSQKFANIGRDDRVSIAIGSGIREGGQIEGLSAAAHASEVTDPQQRERIYDLLVGRHPEYRAFQRPDFKRAAIMRARPVLLTVVDYSQGFGHADVATVGLAGIVEMKAARPDDWGLTPRAASANSPIKPDGPTPTLT